MLSYFGVPDEHPPNPREKIHAKVICLVRKFKIFNCL